jgi:hypothetical protein
MKISFFKTAQPKEFSYRPLYYNERREELEKIKRAVAMEKSSDPGERVKVQLERSWRDRRDRRRTGGSSPVRLLTYLAALAMLIYFIFFYKGF